MKNKELNNILDQVAAGIRNEQVNSAEVNEAKKRVWTRLSSEEGARKMRANRTQDACAPLGAPFDHIEGCADFRSLIPAYMSGNLSEARSLLLVDHTHECIPCRKALKQARETRVTTVDQDGYGKSRGDKQAGRLRS